MFELRIVCNIIHSVPQKDQRADIKHGFHWYLEIVPRGSIPSGFELGLGLFVNTIGPERAARKLGEVKL